MDEGFDMRRYSEVRLSNGLKAQVEHHTRHDLYEALRVHGYEPDEVVSVSSRVMEKTPSPWRDPVAYVADHADPTWSYIEDLAG